MSAITDTELSASSGITPIARTRIIKVPACLPTGGWLKSNGLCALAVPANAFAPNLAEANSKTFHHYLLRRAQVHGCDGDRPRATAERL
jgi:hypothetical protein